MQRIYTTFEALIGWVVFCRLPVILFSHHFPTTIIIIMKKLLTLAAAGTLAAGSFTAQAQVTVDGTLTAAELTAGNYVLLGKYTSPRGFGDYGLISLYAASTPTKMYIFVGGTVENNGNAFQLFMDLPGAAGVPVGTGLPAGTASTSFEKMTAKLDLAADAALALRADGTTAYQVEGASYTPATAVSSAKLTTTAGTISGTGTALTLPATTTVGNYAKFAGARVAYKNSTDGKVLTNAGYNASATAPAYGGVGTQGWEIEIDRTAAGISAAGAQVTLFVIQNNGTGGFLSSDFIPQATGALPTAGGFPSPNLGGPDNNNGMGNSGGVVDFTTIPGRQATTVTLSANGVLGTRNAAAAEAMSLNVFPNPAAGRATVSYNVAKSEQVRVTLTDLMGREVRVLENGVKAAGTQTVSLNSADLAAGTYLVRVQSGEQVATRKVVLL